MSTNFARTAVIGSYRPCDIINSCMGGRNKAFPRKRVASAVSSCVRETAEGRPAGTVGAVFRKREPREI